MHDRTQVEERTWQHIPGNGAEYDVIVCGSGMAGLGAAMTAARRGAKTLLLEAQPVLGGITHFCLWMPLGSWCVQRELLPEGAEDDRRGGIHRIFEEKLDAIGQDGYYRRRLTVHPDYLRVAAFELLEEFGCHYRLYSPVTGVVKEDNAVKGVVVTGKEGPVTFRAKTVIDATGDGDVAFWAGAEFNKGREEDGCLMPVTLTFVVGNADLRRIHDFKPGAHRKPRDWMELNRENKQALMERYKENPGNNTEADDAFNAIIAEAREQGYVTAMWYAFTATSLPGVVTVNNGGLWGVGSLDGTRSADLTFAERVGSKIATDFVEIARKWRIPGLAQCHLLRVGSAVALRETRCIVGDYVITPDDLCEGRVFEDTVAQAYEKMLDTVYFHSAVKGMIGIPYRALLPKGIDGLLVAGRCMSVTHDSLAGIRGMGTVMAVGQAAGTAAALAAEENRPLREIPAARIRAVQEADGVVFRKVDTV